MPKPPKPRKADLGFFLPNVTADAHLSKMGKICVLTTRFCPDNLTVDRTSEPLAHQGFTSSVLTVLTNGPKSPHAAQERQGPYCVLPSPGIYTPLLGHRGKGLRNWAPPHDLRCPDKLLGVRTLSGQLLSTDPPTSINPVSMVTCGVPITWTICQDTITDVT